MCGQKEGAGAERDEDGRTAARRTLTANKTNLQVWNLHTQAAMAF